jgi:hypothetical protein
MKNLYLFIIIFAFSLFSGCNKSAGGGDNPFALGVGGSGTGGGGTGNVTVAVAVIQDGQGQQYFEFTPDTGVVVNQVEVKCAAQGVDETLQGDGQTVYTANNPVDVGPLTQGILQTGQQWTFTIQGKIGSSTGTAYIATPSYTVP